MADRKKRRLLDPKSPSLMPQFVLITIAVQAVCVVLILCLFGTTIALGQQPAPKFVLDGDGNTYAVKVIKTKDPLPEEISQWVGETLYNLFDWRGVLPTLDGKAIAPKKDPGIPIKGPDGKEYKISSSTWVSSFRLEDPFRREMVATLAQLTPQEIFKEVGAQAFFVPALIDSPEKIKDGWKVRIQGKLLVLKSGDNLGQPVPIQYDVFLHTRTGFIPNSAKQAATSEKGQKVIQGAEKEIVNAPHMAASDLQKIVYDSTNRFTIYAMREFDS